MTHLNYFRNGRRQSRKLLLTSALLLAEISLPRLSMAQKANAEVAYFAVQTGPLATALQRLQQEAGVNIVYEASDLKETRVQASEFRGARVSEILRQLLQGQALRFEEKQGVIILQPAPATTPAKPARRAAQEVKGKVTEANGTGIPGVTVMVKGTSVGTVTNAAGDYLLAAPEGAETLVFSFVGYVAHEVPLQGRAVLDVTLAQDLKMLNDVVVIGYGSAKKGEVTSSITTVDPRQFNRGVVATPDQILQGKVAGLNITRSGDPNATASVVLRGASSLRTGQAQEPFYVIDGVPAASINLVAPDEIVSIDVLKDASATAIYGARAANGVIIITTRRQKPNAAVSYSGYVGVEQVSNTIDMLSGEELRRYLEVNGKSLALRWAPVHYQDTDVTGDHGLSGKGDYLTAINFDGDWSGTNNWNNLASHAAAAHGYYSVVETGTHWFVTYAFFHPPRLDRQLLALQHRRARKRPGRPAGGH